MIHVRTAIPADVAAIQRITAASPTAPQWTAAQILESILPSGSTAIRRTVLIAELSTEGPGPIGFAGVSALVSVYPVEAELESIAVDPAHRGRGAAAALLQRVERWIFSLGVDAGNSLLRLEVRASNEPALRLYQRYGFRRSALRAAYYADPVEDAVLMERHVELRTASTITRMPPDRP